MTKRTEDPVPLDKIDLSTEALLLTLTVKKAALSKTDRAVTDDILVKHSASADSGRFTKKLWDKTFISPILKIQGQIRNYVYQHTYEWRRGERMLPITMHPTLDAHLNKLLVKFEDLRCNLRDNAAAQIAVEKARLGTLWNADDYPTPEELYDAFAIEIHTRNVDDPRDFRFKIAAQAMEKVISQSRSRHRTNLEAAHRESYRKLLEPLTHAAKTLQDPEQRFSSTLISNLVHVCDVMDALNIAKDPVLSEMASAIRQDLKGVKVEELREDPEVRKAVAQTTQDAAEKVISRMNKVFGEAKPV